MYYRHFIFYILSWLCLHGYHLEAQVLLPSRNDTRNMQLLNGTWKFKYLPSANPGNDSLFYNNEFDVSHWLDIVTPGNWDMQGFADPKYGKNLKEATGLYKTSFMVPSNWKGDAVFIAFDGVAFGYSFWVNGHYAGAFASTFNRQTFDISAFIAPGKSNQLAVKVITHPKGWEFDTNDDWSLCGIIRDVTLFRLPPVHIKDVIIKTYAHPGDTSIYIKTSINTNSKENAAKEMLLTGQLMNPEGQLVSEFSFNEKFTNAPTGVVDYTKQVSIKKARLWCAENPQLYTLRLLLKANGSTIQSFTDRVGIREITWTDGIFRINGIPVKLRGATHHDLSPVNGRSITRAEMIQDIQLMQQANMNFIRTSHYPPHPALLELCDSMGFYVMDEVPYGYGEEHLLDSSYLTILKDRARLTLWRDKNRPCVIIWSVGNENPVTDIGLITGRYVKSLDETRPYCFPQTPTEFEKMLKAIPDSLDILDDHYPMTTDLRKYIRTINRPMVASEYAHALGLDFNNMDSIFEVMYAHPQFMGGAVWEFFDQGILRKSAKKILKDEATLFAWPTGDSLFDTEGNQGTDGIVYANRVPQVDYWQARKVYSPVKALDDSLQYKPGEQTYYIRLNNRFDFTNLSVIKCKWLLYADTVMIRNGIAALSCKPHDTITLPLVITLPSKPIANYYYLKLLFENKRHEQFYEKTYVLQQKESSFQDRLIVSLTPATNNMNNTAAAWNYHFELNDDNKSFSLRNKNGDLIITKGIFARVGRKPTMAQDATLGSRRSANKHTTSNQYLLNSQEAVVKENKGNHLTIQYTYHPDSLQQASISGDIVYNFNNEFIEVRYRLIPQGKEEAVETGVSFLIPDSLTEFRWIGKGPYEAYPGKDKLSEFGFFHLNSNDLYYAGNRQLVDCAIFTDKKGKGFALLANKADISVERTKDGLIVSHKSFVASRFNKYTWPDSLFAFKDEKQIAGRFTIVPLSKDEWPEALKKLFGNPTSTTKPFQPFYHSYDQ